VVAGVATAGRSAYSYDSSAARPPRFRAPR
jgi:hypothetical protein